MNRKFDIQTNNEQCTIKVYVQTVTTRQPVRAVFSHKTQQGTVYYDHLQEITGKGCFYIRLPQSPKNGVLTIESRGAFYMPRIPYDVLPLNQKLTAFNYKNSLIKEFVNFAQWYCEDYALLSAGGSVYQSRGLNFRIDNHVALKDRKSGAPLKTPARIGVQSRIIETASSYFMKYSVPERFCILAHEFGHGYLNHKMESEFEADRNALDICLGLGYPRSAIKKVFLRVFSDSPTEGNLKRWQLIRDYVDNFAKADPGDEYYYNNESQKA